MTRLACNLEPTKRVKTHRAHSMFHVLGSFRIAHIISSRFDHRFSWLPPPLNDIGKIPCRSPTFRCNRCTGDFPSPDRIFHVVLNHTFSNRIGAKVPPSFEPFFRSSSRTQQITIPREISSLNPLSVMIPFTAQNNSLSFDGPPLFPSSG